MRNGILIFLCGLLMVGILFSIAYTTREQSIEILDLREEKEVSIVLSDQGFMPRYVRIRVGTVIVFTTTRPNQYWPASDEHPSHALYRTFDPMKPIESDESWSFAVDRTGDWGYHDHLRSYFTGRLYVE